MNTKKYNGTSDEYTFFTEQLQSNEKTFTKKKQKSKFY